MNHEFAIAFEAMLATVAKEAASEAIRQFRIEEQRRQQQLSSTEGSIAATEKNQCPFCDLDLAKI